MNKRNKIIFLTRSLQRGGAERQLVVLATGLHEMGWDVLVACFYAGGEFERDLELAGVPVIDLAKGGRWDVPGFVWRLMALVRKVRPDFVHGYLPVPNILALLAPLVAPRTKVVWGIRASNMDLSRYDRLARLIMWLQCRLARYAALIIANSWAGSRYHVDRGFPGSRMRVIPNGIDVTRFGFDSEGRQRMRAAWGIPMSAMLVGVVGRLDPMKDHPNFLHAAANLMARHPSWWFVCVGHGGGVYRAELLKLTDQLGLHGRLIWAGATDEMSSAFSAIDLVVSSSYGEGFPNVLAEAMACGRSCVATDVGDSALVVGELGVVVPPQDPIALAEGIERLHRLIDVPSDVRACAVRQRVMELFGVERLVRATAIALQSSSLSRRVSDEP